MPIQKTQATPVSNTTNTTSITATFSTPPKVGAGIVIGIVTSAGDTWAPTTTDNKGNTYAVAKVQGPGIGTGCSGIIYCNKVLTSGGTFTITINCNLAGDMMVRAVEINGELTIDRTIGGAVNGTTPTINTPTLIAADVFVMQCISIWAAQTSIAATAANPASPAWTEEAEKLTGAVAGQIDSRILTGMAGVLTSCNWTTNPGGWCDYVLAAFSVSNFVPGGGGNPTRKPEKPPKFVRTVTAGGSVIICKSDKYA